MGRSVGRGSFWLVDSRCTETIVAPLRDAHCFHQIVHPETASVDIICGELLRLLMPSYLQSLAGNLPQVLAAVLSFGLMVGGCVVKLPQLLKIYQARSVAGLSELSVFVEAGTFVLDISALKLSLETLGAWLFVSYNVLEHHPLMTWGEMIPVALLNLTITLLFWKFRPIGEARRATTRSMTAARATKERTFSPVERRIAASSLVLLTLVVFWMHRFSQKGARSYDIFSSLLGLSPVPLLLLSRIPQILQNVEQGHTGQLSAGSYMLMVSGNLARLYTTVTNLSDSFILLSCSLAFVLNVIPLTQIVWYRQRTKELLKRSERPVSRSRGKVKAT